LASLCYEIVCPYTPFPGKVGPFSGLEVIIPTGPLKKNLKKGHKIKKFFVNSAES